MNRKAFYRKVAYFAAIAVLLLPLSWLGQPPAGVDGRGGKLAELRREHNLSQAELGEIDPASETMRLATLGLTGVAANVLWHKAIQYKTKKDWSNFMAAANQIIKLQPNFIEVWEFQAHNISYNTSVEFDDYKYRYAWVKRGIEYLIEGTRYNRDEPRLLSSTGHFFGQKIARSDERRQFRQLFAHDRDFHAEFDHLIQIDDAIGQSGFPDNWLVARLWYLRAQNVVDSNPDRPLRGESPLHFHSHPPKSRINYAIDNEKDGYHGERARSDWEKAYREYALEYASREIPTSFGHTLRLNERERALADAERLRGELEQLAGVTFESIQEEKRAALSPEERAAHDTPAEKRTDDQHRLVYTVYAKLQVDPLEVAKRAPADQRREAERIANTIADLELLADRVQRYRDQVNFDYWKTRCEVEMTPLADRARQLVHDAEEEYRQARIIAAKEKFEEAWKAWETLFEQYPDLIDDQVAADLVPTIHRYENVLHQIDEEMPEDFLLSEILEKHDDTWRVAADAARRAAKKKSDPDAEKSETPGETEDAPAAESEKEPAAEAEKEPAADTEKQPTGDSEKESAAEAEKEPAADSELSEEPAPEDAAPAPSDKAPDADDLDSSSPEAN